MWAILIWTVIIPCTAWPVTAFKFLAHWQEEMSSVRGREGEPAILEKKIQPLPRVEQNEIEEPSLFH